MILFGDFNVDCVLLIKKCLDKLELWIELGFYWVIVDGEDIIVWVSIYCIYDCVVLYGECCWSLLYIVVVFDFFMSF